MTGMAIAAVAGSAMQYKSGKDAQNSADASSERADALAREQWAYQQQQMGYYQEHLQQQMKYVQGAAWDTNQVVTHGYDPTQLGQMDFSGMSPDEMQRAQAFQGQAFSGQGDNQAGIAAAQGFLDDWADTFGGLEDNLSNYYNNLDPDKFATQNKVALQQNLDKSMNQFNESMAASGLQSSGMKQQAAKEAMFAQATGNSNIDINAPEQVAQMQQGFLNYGAPFKQQAQSMLSNATNLDSNIKSQVSMGNASNATQASLANASNATQASMFNAGQYNNRGMDMLRLQNDRDQFNANATNRSREYNAGEWSRADILNADIQNKNRYMYNSALFGASSDYNNSYLQMAQMSNPNIARNDNAAQQYGQSAAGYSAASGKMLGTAMNLGIQAYNGS
ncbi:MAG: hypothetical protein DRI37_05185 [Chloroflexi bacterium]|nr:MAG: hypothetical protein DRI37_05185 [Chloroflexota bacterium]